MIDWLWKYRSNLLIDGLCIIDAFSKYKGGIVVEYDSEKCYGILSVEC